jgi:hypothetical protein
VILKALAVVPHDDREHWLAHAGPTNGHVVITGHTSTLLGGEAGHGGR